MSVRIGFKFVYCDRRWEVTGFSGIKVFFRSGETSSLMDRSIFERDILGL